MTFAEAVEAMVNGNKITRRGWGNNKKFIYLVTGSKASVPNLRNKSSMYIGWYLSTYHKAKNNCRIDMKSNDGSILLGWIASQADRLSEDWEIISSAN